jgi:undecaprenyl-diphosphatase
VPHTVAAAIYHMSFVQAVVIGLIQGFFEIFPVSSLGHTVLIPSWIGGSWATLVHQESLAESPYLAFVVGLHLANALALLLFYLREWGRIIAGFFRSLVRRRVESDTERLAWMIVVATIPVGLIGLALEHTFRVLFAKPLAAALFLMCNGVILLGAEWAARHRGAAPADGEQPLATAGSVAPIAGGAASERTRFRDEHLVAIDDDAERALTRVGTRSAFVIGLSQALALLAGISREGVVMAGGLFRGLTRENAMRFAFLLSTPVIFAAGILKVPDLMGTLGNGIRGQVLAGSAAAVVASFVTIAFLARYFKTRTLVPFAIYSLLFGFASVIRFGLF